MPGPKTNERPGTRASVRNVRGSASKARRQLDLIRNESATDAIQILTFSDTGVSEVILKVLNSAIANADHNDDIPMDELFVAACYADEGPTMKRFRPRARGRASRINKRTSHITIIVARYEADELEARRAKSANAAGSSAAQAESRRRRVAKSQDEEAAPEAPAETPAAETAPAVDAAASMAGDDLTVINGIGPKFAETLTAAGVGTIAALANLDDARKAELAEEIKGDDIDAWVAEAQGIVAAGDSEDAPVADADSGEEEE